jgi:8-oxo-dGTP pyrophosphatase MutT (NUDIX family)
MTGLIKGLSILDADAVTHHQSAALCWRKRRGELQVLLVTSRETGRWIIPKGWPIAGLSDAETAAREALEEAGVIGKLRPVALGTYGYDKVVDRATPAAQALSCLVTVFALRVTELRSRYREVSLRKRKWFACDAAAAKVDEADLKALIGAFDPDKLAVVSATE